MSRARVLGLSRPPLSFAALAALAITAVAPAAYAQTPGPKQAPNPQSAHAQRPTAVVAQQPATKKTVTRTQRAAIAPGKIKNIVVIDLENEDYDVTFGADSPAAYLNTVLAKQGQIVENYYATSHVSQGNYISQISGQASTGTQNSDCIDLASLSSGHITGAFTNITPGTPTSDGQVVGDGCVFPKSVATIGAQLDAAYGGSRKGAHTYRYPWRVYAEDMGNIPARDYGSPDTNPGAVGGTTCAHPPINGVDNSNSAVAGDGYATRHNPFMYFHSVIDDPSLCNERVVPLGTLSLGTGKKGKDTFTGHLVSDFKAKKTTPAFSFVIPDLCNDGHDATCQPAQAGGSDTDVEGGNGGGLTAADLWLKHWVPTMMASPSYRSGEMLIVITLDEAGFNSTTSYAALPGQPVGPNQSGNPGYSPILGMMGYQEKDPTPGTYPGGGKTGALLLNKKYIAAGTVNTTGAYNHYSALRSYEDILGVTSGGTDGLGHLGYAGQAGLVPFGKDVFNARR
ncbi:MAG: hypothetical protein ACK5MP_02820 [Nostocoides sp.]